jgi:hypothetical protein
MLIALQVFLSMQKNKWLGLILPIINVLLIFLAPLLGFIFTAIVLALMLVSINLSVYFICRNKLKEKSIDEITKMKINDL